MQPLLQWKTINNKHSAYLFVVLVMQYAMLMRRIVICGLPGSSMFFHNIW